MEDDNAQNDQNVKVAGTQEPKPEQPISPEQPDANNGFEQKVATDVAMVTTNQTGESKIKRGKKTLIIIILTLLLLAGGTVAYYFLYVKNNDNTTQQSRQTQNNNEQIGSEQPDATEPTKLVYAYKEGATTTVRELVVASGKKSELFKFDELREVTKTDEFYYTNQPSITTSPDSSQYAYIDATGFWTKGTARQPAVKALAITSDSTGPLGTTYNTNPALPDSNSGPKGNFAFYGPNWSIDSKVISFVAGLYEGSIAYSYDVASKSFDSSTDRFRYVDESKLGDSFEIIQENKPFFERGVLPGYLIKPNSYLQSPIYSTDKAHIFGILCPPDLPGSGNSMYADSFDGSGRRDCGEAEERQVVAVSTADGSYSAVVSGQYATDLIRVGDVLYTPSREAKDLKVFAIENGQVSEIALTSHIKDAESIEGISLHSVGRPLVSVYYKKGNEYHVVVVDVWLNKSLNDFLIDKHSAFAPLAYK